MKALKIGCAGLFLLWVIGFFVQRVFVEPREQSEQAKRLASPTRKWTMLRSRSSFDDSPTVELQLKAEAPISGWPGVTRTPTLILRCNEHKIDALISIGMRAKTSFGEYGRDLGTSTRGRYDKGEVFEYLMPKSTDGQAFFFPKPIEEIKYMMKHSPLVLEFTPFNSNPVEMRFEIAGVLEAIKPLREACSW